MGRKRKIYEKDIRYDALHWLTAKYIRLSFRRYVCIGKENIPDDGAIIFAPNHCNTLMDPFAILGSFSKHLVFVARADIFRGKRAAEILNFLKMMPINRKRDGLMSVLNTEQTIANSIEVLNNSVPFCILPEGTHRTMHSLMSIGKGIARVACGAVESCSRPVYIVPIGLEYGDYFRYRSTLVVTYGQPINITALMEEMKDCSQLEIYNKVRALTRDGIRNNIVYIPDDQDYDAMWELAKIWSSRVPEMNPVGRLNANRDASAKLVKLRNESPEKASSLFSRALAYREARIKNGISLHIGRFGNIFFETILRTLVSLVALPFALVWAAASLPAWGIGEFLCFKGKDTAFNNSLRCSALDFIWTFCLIVWTVVLFLTLKPAIALLAIAYLIPSPFFAYDYVEFFRRTVSCWRALFHRSLIRENRNLFEEMAKL